MTPSTTPARNPKNAFTYSGNTRCAVGRDPCPNPRGIDDLLISSASASLASGQPSLQQLQAMAATHMIFHANGLEVMVSRTHHTRAAIRNQPFMNTVAKKKKKPPTSSVCEVGSARTSLANVHIRGLDVLSSTTYIAISPVVSLTLVFELNSIIRLGPGR